MATLFISVQAGCSTTTRTVHAQGGPFEGLTALYDTLLAATALGGSAAPGIWPSSPVPGDQVITPADQGTWLLYTVGQRFVLKLGSGFQWTVRLSTSGVIKRVPGIATIRGAQGIYVVTAGQTTLTALGVPTCATATQCPTPTQEFTVRVTVRPRI